MPFLLSKAFFSRAGLLQVLWLPLLFLQCTKDEEGRNIQIWLHLSYAGVPVVLQEQYTYPDGKTFIPTRFTTFVSDLSLSGGNTTRTLEEVLFVHMGETLKDAISSQRGYLLFEGKVDLSHLERLDFNLGLNPEQNKTVPADYPSGHPLAQTGEYWLAWKSYIFTKIEGWIDLDGDGEAETGVALHLGSDEARQSISLSVPDEEEIHLEIDLEKVFNGAGSIYEIAAIPQIHSLSQMPAILELGNNLKNAVAIKN